MLARQSYGKPATAALCGFGSRGVCRSGTMSRSFSNAAANSKATSVMEQKRSCSLSANALLRVSVDLAQVARPRFFHVSSAAREVVKVPSMAESISEGTLKQWLKKAGDYVEADEEVATIETDKIDVSVNAPSAGTIVETYANEEDTVTVGQDLYKLEAGEKPAESSDGSQGKEESKDEGKGESKEESKDEGKSDEGEKKKKAKSEEEVAESQEKDGSHKAKDSKGPTPQPGQGKEKKDESSPKTADKKPPPKQSGSKKTADPKGASSKDVQTTSTPGTRDETRVKMSRMRLRIAERLKQSQNTAASLTTFNEIDMSALMAFRSRHKDNVLKHHGVKLGFMSAFAKATAIALKEIPAANASIEGEGLGDTIVYRDYVDLSVAVSTDKGLVTPVVRNIETMGLIQIEKEIAELGAKARANKLTLEDMSGGTFTISNGGVFGSLFGTPILNLPGSAILGMHAIKDKAWVVDGKVEIRPIMVVALTYDHRLLDGREAVTFLVRLKQYIEDMGSMLLL